MLGAPITIRCDCGQTRYVPYGERWQCEKCGRRWNTAQIPAEEYWGIMYRMRRFRVSAITTAFTIAGGFVFLGLFLGHRFFLLLPVVLGIWFFWYMPFWRQKVRRAARSVPTWELHPE